MVSNYLGLFGYIKSQEIIKDSTTDKWVPKDYILKECSYLYNNDKDKEFAFDIPLRLNPSTMTIEMSLVINSRENDLVMRNPKDRDDCFKIHAKQFYGIMNSFWGNVPLTPDPNTSQVFPNLTWVEPGNPTEQQLRNLSNLNTIKLDGPNRQFYQNSKLVRTLTPDEIYSNNNVGDITTFYVPYQRGLGYIKIWQNEQLIHYIYPTYDENNKKCFYDKINANKFYYSGDQSNIYIGPLVE